ncbi:MAG: hypothetical protein DRP83_02880 [Planctomycetota bacterium]|nr:MAG: hypothetical protein DRP83_02880 [Planctomycetota bacterium]
MIGTWLVYGVFVLAMGCGNGKTHPAAETVQEPTINREEGILPISHGQARSGSLIFEFNLVGKDRTLTMFLKITNIGTKKLLVAKIPPEYWISFDRISENEILPWVSYEGSGSRGFRTNVCSGEQLPINNSIEDYVLLVPGKSTKQKIFIRDGWDVVDEIFDKDLKLSVEVELSYEGHKIEDCQEEGFSGTIIFRANRIGGVAEQVKPDSLIEQK